MDLTIKEQSNAKHLNKKSLMSSEIHKKIEKNRYFPKKKGVDKHLQKKQKCFKKPKKPRQRQNFFLWI